MKRAIKNLCQLPDDALFKEVETGISHIMDVVNRLDTAAEELHGTGRHYPSRVLEYFAAEEAAKVLILVDAVRCPKNKGEEKSRTLGYFYDHIAKGIYAKVCDWRPIDLAEVRKGVDDERREFYLDGPNDVDWIFPNSIAERRENRLYVGYVCEDTERKATKEKATGHLHSMRPDFLNFLVITHRRWLSWLALFTKPMRPRRMVYPSSPRIGGTSMCVMRCVLTNWKG